MVKLQALEEVLTTLNEIKESGLSIAEYFNYNEKEAKSFYNKVNHAINTETQSENKELQAKIKSDYTELKKSNSRNYLDNDTKTETNFIRDDEGKITGYYFKVYRRDKTPITGTLTRDEMNMIHRLYSYYGSSITQREISRKLPEYSLVDFKRILRAFNITKASGPFAPHMYEEHSEDQLKEIHAREKENDFLKRIERDEINDIKQAATKLARDNFDLQTRIVELSKDLNINITFPENWKDPQKDIKKSNKSMIIYLADMHVGAKCESYTLYPNPYDKKEIKRRLDQLLKCIKSFGHLDTLVINLMGDSLDGMDQQTARRDHIMPQCMDNMEQLETFLELTTSFIANCKAFANEVKVYSVKCGNHGGTWEYTANLALKNVIEKTFPDIKFVLFKEFIGAYEFNNHLILCCHGKDERFMKKGLPVNLDERTKIMIQEWLVANNFAGNENIHFVKGDLHSNALQSCKMFDYRNVLSLFGASDYSGFNFSQNSYGVSYDLFIGDNRTIGTFENF